MKKLKLKALELGAKEILTREQLKNIIGGDGGGCSSCEFTGCDSNHQCDTSSSCPGKKVCVLVIRRTC
jgi:hypothetical protein